MKAKIETVPLKDLQVNLFVRQVLDQEHALMLAGLMEAGVELPPIQITPDRRVIDGRHRIEAAGVNLLKTIKCEVVEVADETEFISLAYRANAGGSLPPRKEDTEHTVMLLLDRGVGQRAIAEMLGLPPSLARKYVKDVQSRMARTKLQRAAEAVTDGGLTIQRAAEQYDVDVEKLREVLGGRRRKHKHGIADLQRDLTKTFKSIASRNASTMRRILEKYEDGDVTARQVHDVIAHIEQLQKKGMRSTADWKDRFAALQNGAKEARASQ